MQVCLQVKTSLCVEFSTRSHAYHCGLALYVCHCFDFCFFCFLYTKRSYTVNDKKGVKGLSILRCVLKRMLASY